MIPSNEEIAVLRRICRHIAAEPNRFAMGVVSQHALQGRDLRIAPNHWNDYKVERIVVPPCGTVACISGWWDVLAGSVMQKTVLNRLVSVSSWPHTYRTNYGKATTAQERVEIAVARIEHFIETGE